LDFFLQLGDLQLLDDLLRIVEVRAMQIKNDEGARQYVLQVLPPVFTGDYTLNAHRRHKLNVHL